MLPGRIERVYDQRLDANIAAFGFYREAMFLRQNKSCSRYFAMIDERLNGSAIDQNFDRPDFFSGRSRRSARLNTLIRQAMKSAAA